MFLRTSPPDDGDDDYRINDVFGKQFDPVDSPNRFTAKDYSRL